MRDPKWATLALKRSAQFIKKISDQYRGEDETVEGQSKAFRLWMMSSTAAVLLMLLMSFSSSKGSEPQHTDRSTTTLSLAEQVPDGFVLVPIEPINFETIDAIVEDHAYVDLYLASNDELSSYDASSSMRKKRLIARGLPLVRAPKNPSRFAVLVKESDSNVLTRLGGPVQIVVRRGPPKGGYPEPKFDSSTRAKHVSKPVFIVEEIPDSSPSISN